MKQIITLLGISLCVVGVSATEYPINPKFQITDSNGRPLVGGKVYFYDGVAGSPTSATVYSDSAGTTPITQPLVLNARGEGLAYGHGTYDIYVYNSAGTLVYTLPDYPVLEVSSFSAGLLDNTTARTWRSGLDLGTAAILNAGTSANNVVQLDSNAKLPALDGSALINLASAMEDLCPRGYLAGLKISNDVTDGTNDIVISAGTCRDASNTEDMTLTTALTKRIDTSWVVGSGQGGLGTGVPLYTPRIILDATKSASGTCGILVDGASVAEFPSDSWVLITNSANNDGKYRCTGQSAIFGDDRIQLTFDQTHDSGMDIADDGPDGGGYAVRLQWYHVFLVKEITSGTVDAIITDATATPTLPSGYDVYRRIGSILRNGAGEIVQFVQRGDEFWWEKSQLDVYCTEDKSLNTKYDIYLGFVPGGIETKANVDVASWGGTSGVNSRFKIYPTFQTVDNVVQTHIHDEPTTFRTKDGFTIADQGTDVKTLFQNTWIYMDENGEFSLKADTENSGTTIEFYCRTIGYTDRRGQDD